MNKELKELLDKINAKKQEVKDFVSNKKIEEAKAAKEELKNLQAEFDILYDLEDSENAGKEEGIKNGAGIIVTPNPNDATKEFAAAAKRGFKVENMMSRGSDPDGGYTVPEDIQTQINTYRDSKFSLRDLVRVENVTTDKGSRTFKKRSQQTGFTKVGEKQKIGKKNTPQFERISYEIDKYGGYFPVTNDLLYDTDQNIAATLIEWIGDESRVTANNLIIQIIKTKAETNLEGLDGIKKALNVTLGSTFKPTAKIVTNDDGLHYLDTLKDSDGKYLLQPDPANPLQLRLCAGANVIHITVVPNKDMASTGNKVPFIIGDLQEAVVLWDRQKTSIMTSNIAVVGSGDDQLNAFEEDLTIYRALEREDVTLRDGAAFINGYIDITP